MTAEGKMTATTAVPWYTKPAVVIALLAALVALTALLARTPVTGRSGDQRLSTSSADPLGAKLLYELADGLGWSVSRDSRGTVPTSIATIYSVLDPVVPITPQDAGAMLAHVRRGGAMLLVLGKGTSPLSDSLQLTVDRQGADVAANIGAVRPCKGQNRLRFTREALWFGAAHLLALKGRGLATPGIPGPSLGLSQYLPGWQRPGDRHGEDQGLTQLARAAQGTADR